MIAAVDYKDENGLVRFIRADVFDKRTLARAELKFVEYRKKGIVLNDDYEDDVWILSDDIETVKLRFVYDRKAFIGHAGQWIGCSYEDYVIYAKAFAALSLGSLVLPSIRLAVKVTRDLTGMDPEDVPYIREASTAAAFLSLIPDERSGLDEIRESIDEEKRKVSAKHPRHLRPFREYVEFNDAEEKLWAGLSDDKKIYYFPVRLWWTLTTILPLRPTEFLLIPEDCVSVKNGERVMAVRRTRLKKKLEKVTYSIDGDYEIRQYEIPEKLGGEIVWYQEKTSGMERKGVDTLFTTGDGTGFLSYDIMRARLDGFCEEAGFTGGRMHLGDTRHLAMVNLILSGGSPSVCRDLAGHENIDISSNYYANLSEIIRESIYDYCHRNSGSAFIDGRQFYPLSVPVSSVRVDGGWCAAPEMADGSIEACLKTFSDRGGIGDCRRCIHFYPDDPGIRLEMENEKKRQVDEDGEFLMLMIEQVRKGNGCEESIRQALGKLQNSSHDYENVLYRKYQEEILNG